jgi:hypothetical protein
LIVDVVIFGGDEFVEAAEFAAVQSIFNQITEESPLCILSHEQPGRRDANLEPGKLG